MGEVARLLLSYVHHWAQSDPTAQPKELQSQRWAAMAYLDETRPQAVGELVQALTQCVVVNPQKPESVKGISWNELGRPLRFIDELAPQTNRVPGTPGVCQARVGHMSDLSGDENLMLLETNVLSQNFMSETRPAQLDPFCQQKQVPQESAAGDCSQRNLEVNRSCYQNSQPISGTVISAVKGGLRVDVGGIVAFMPASQIDTYFVANLEVFQEQEIEALVTEASEKRAVFVISRRARSNREDVANVEKHLRIVKRE